jgi:TM2 domain-containing membrane protein YozV/ribosomal protein L40E
MKQENEKYCAECGALIKSKAEICPNCGVRQLKQFNISNEDKSEQRNRWLTVLLLCWFLGIFGIHRFYSGHTGIGIAQLLTLGGCGIWTLIDFIIIVSGNFKDAQGNPIKNV